MWLGLGWYVRLLLEKLGVSEWRAFGIEIKISKWESWVLRHPITNLVIMMPTDMQNDKWHKVSASLDDTHVKLISTTGIWRKTYTWQSMAKITDEEEKNA